jgi:hypothetical protein
MAKVTPRRSPVRHWHCRWASSASHGTPFRPYAHHGQQAPLTGAIQGFGAQCQSARHCRRCGYPSISRQGHRLRRVIPATLMTLGAWLRACTVTPVVVGGSVGSVGAYAPARGWTLFQGSGEAEPMPKVSGEVEPAPKGSGKTETIPLGSGEAEAMVTPLIVWVR